MRSLHVALSEAVIVRNWMNEFAPGATIKCADPFLIVPQGNLEALYTPEAFLGHGSVIYTD